MLETTRSSVAAISAAMLLACSETGGFDGPLPQCTDQPSVALRDDELAPIGIASSALQDLVGETLSLQLARAGADSAPLMATLALHLRPGSARYVPSARAQQLTAADPCRGRIDQDVQLELRLGAGDLDQPLLASGVLGADSLYRARLSAQLPAQDLTALGGSELQPGESCAGLGLRALVTPAGSTGQLTGVFESLVHIGPQPEPAGGAPRARDYVTSRSAPLAHWPADTTCAAGDLPLALERSLYEITAGQVRVPFEQPLPLTWRDGTTSMLALTAAAVGGACMSDTSPQLLNVYGSGAFLSADPALFQVPIALSIATSDGRFSSQVQSTLQYQASPTAG
jgi:hypothetical protein